MTSRRSRSTQPNNRRDDQMERKHAWSLRQTAWIQFSDNTGAAPWFTNVAGFPNPTGALWMPIADGNATYYFRKTFTTDRIGTPKTVTVSGDDVVNVYLDGVLKASSTNWQVPATFTFTPSGFGSHVIAIEATNNGGPGGVLVDVR
jgi:hypothetical protein